MNGRDASLTETNRLLAAVIMRHGAKWLRFVRRILGSQEDAEDVLQEAARRVLAHGRLLCSEREMKMYLGRAISNCAIEFYHSRRRAGRRERRIRHYCHLPTFEHTNPYFLLEEQESYQLKTRLLGVIEGALRRLSAKQYEALRLTIMDSADTSLRQAGTINGIPYSTLRHRSRQGLLKLRKLVQRAIRTRFSSIAMV